MAPHDAPRCSGGASDRRRLMFFSTAVLCAAALSAMALTALHLRPLADAAWLWTLTSALGETLVVVIAGGTLLVRVCNPFIRRLEESDARLRAIVATAGDGIITLDERGRINSFNRAAERIFGRDAAAVLGRPIDQLLLLSSGLSFLRELGDCRDAPEGHTSQKAMGRAGDMLFPVELSLACVSSGEPSLFTVIVRDTTERETVQQQLRSQMIKLEEIRRTLEARADELARTNRDLDDLTYIASHDLKEPLRGISAYCQLLLEDYGQRLDADGKRRLRVMVDLCQRLGRLIDDVLTYSKIGRREPETAKVDLGAIVRDVLETLSAAIEERAARVAIADCLPQVTADRVLVGEVFRNLVANALKFNASAQPTIEIGSLADGTIYVRDNGIGIPACHHEAIFAMFRRLHARDEYEGTGAGLTFVRKIVEAHGGRVWVESQPGTGSTFHFTLGTAANRVDGPRAEVAGG